MRDRFRELTSGFIPTPKIIGIRHQLLWNPGLKKQLACWFKMFGNVIFKNAKEPSRSSRVQFKSNFRVHQAGLGLCWLFRVLNVGRGICYMMYRTQDQQPK